MEKGWCISWHKTDTTQSVRTHNEQFDYTQSATQSHTCTPHKIDTTYTSSIGTWRYTDIDDALDILISII